MAIKQNTANWLPVRLVDATDAPVTGLAFNAVAITNTFKLCKAGVAAATWNPPNAGAWIEDGSGYYRALLAAGDCDTLGLLTLIAVTTTGQPFESVERVESTLPADTYSRVGAPAGASVSADIAAIQAKTVNLPASPAAVGSNMGTVASVTGNVGGSVVGDVQGKVLGGGASAMTAAGVRAVDSAGNAIAPAATAVLNTDLTPTRAGKLDNLDAAITTRAPAATALSSADYTAARAGKLDQLDAAVTTRAAAATAVSSADLTPARAAKLDNLDTNVGSRLASGSYTAPDNATIASTASSVSVIRGKTDNLPANPASQTNLDVPVSTRLAAADYVAPDNAGIGALDDDMTTVLVAAAAIKAKTDALPASPANEATSAAIQGVVSGNAVTLSAVAAQLERSLGLLDENTVRDQITPNDDGDVVSARIRLFDDDPATGNVIATYAATYTYSAPGVLESATVARLS
jgi:hypothetical protein